MFDIQKILDNFKAEYNAACELDQQIRKIISESKIKYPLDYRGAMGHWHLQSRIAEFFKNIGILVNFASNAWQNWDFSPAQIQGGKELFREQCEIVRQNIDVLEGNDNRVRIRYVKTGERFPVNVDWGNDHNINIAFNAVLTFLVYGDAPSQFAMIDTSIRRSNKSAVYFADVDGNVKYFFDKNGMFVEFASPELRKRFLEIIGGK